MALNAVDALLARDESLRPRNRFDANRRAHRTFPAGDLERIGCRLGRRDPARAEGRHGAEVGTDRDLVGIDRFPAQLQRSAGVRRDALRFEYEDLGGRRGRRRSGKRGGRGRLGQRRCKGNQREWRQARGLADALRSCLAHALEAHAREETRCTVPSSSSILTPRIIRAPETARTPVIVTRMPAWIESCLSP